MKRVSGISGLLLALLLTSCLQNNTDVAGGTETETTITGIMEKNGNPAGGVVVTLYPDDFIPMRDQVTDGMRLVTNSQGEYNFRVPDTGIYNIHGFLPESNVGTILRGIEVPGTGESNITVLPLELGKVSTVEIHIQERPFQEGGFIYLPGTGVFKEITGSSLGNNIISLEGIPPSTYPSVDYAAPGDFSGNNILESDLVIESGDPTVLGPYYNWRDTVRLILNTTSDGASVMEDVLDFALLVRLNTEEFPGAHDSGYDIRFTKSDGFSVLDYEIERWDPEMGLAEIWVRIDTVYGNNNDQSIRMYWGYSGMNPLSNSEKVFETNSGFAATWHLGESLLDATSNNNDGTDAGTSVIEGVIGKGRSFQGSGQHLNFGNGSALKTLAESITVSCWLNTGMVNDTLINNVSIIRHDGHITALQIAFMSQDAWSAVWSPGINLLPYTWDGVFNDNSWHYFVSTYHSHTGLKIYKDGLLYHVNESVQGPLSTQTSHDFLLGGAESRQEDYIGLLDEVRVESALRTDAWIKLNFETQKPGADALTILP